MHLAFVGFLFSSSYTLDCNATRVRTTLKTCFAEYRLALDHQNCHGDAAGRNFDVVTWF